MCACKALDKVFDRLNITNIYIQSHTHTHMSACKALDKVFDRLNITNTYINTHTHTHMCACKALDNHSIFSNNTALDKYYIFVQNKTL